MKKEFPKKGDRWLFTDWGFGLSEFKIFDDFNYFNRITQRTINDGNYTNWFNIDNVRREIEEYAKNNNVKIKGLDRTIQSIRSHGFSYTDKGKDKAIKDANERNNNRDRSNKYSKEIRIIE